MADNSRDSQAVAAEAFAGLVRGAGRWPLSAQQKLWASLSPPLSARRPCVHRPVARRLAGVPALPLLQPRPRRVGWLATLLVEEAEQSISGRQWRCWWRRADAGGWRRRRRRRCSWRAAAAAAAAARRRGGARRTARGAFAHPSQPSALPRAGRGRARLEGLAAAAPAARGGLMRGWVSHPYRQVREEVGSSSRSPSTRARRSQRARPTRHPRARSRRRLEAFWAVPPRAAPRGSHRRRRRRHRPRQAAAAAAPAASEARRPRRGAPPGTRLGGRAAKGAARRARPRCAPSRTCACRGARAPRRPRAAPPPVVMAAAACVQPPDLSNAAKVCMQLSRTSSARCARRRLPARARDGRSSPSPARGGCAAASSPSSGQSSTAPSLSSRARSTRRPSGPSSTA